MPPLQNSSTAKQGVIDDPTPTREKVAFKPDDIVVLKGLTNANLNGQRAVICNSRNSTHPDRCAVRIISTNQKLSMKYDKMEKLYPEGGMLKTDLEVTKFTMPAKVDLGLVFSKPAPVPINRQHHFGGNGGDPF